MNHKSTIKSSKLYWRWEGKNLGLKCSSSSLTFYASSFSCKAASICILYAYIKSGCSILICYGSVSKTGGGVEVKNLICSWMTSYFMKRTGCLIPLFMEYPAKFLLYS